MKKKVKSHFFFTDLTFRGQKVFLATEVSTYLNRSESFASSKISSGELIRSIDFFRLTIDENKKFVEENDLWSDTRYKHNAYQIRNIITLEGLKKLHEISSNDPFTFNEVENKAIVQANVNEISIKEYKGVRVVTLKDVDWVHGRPEGTAKRNFNQNKKHLIESEDYYVITRNEFRTEFGFGKNAPTGILLTESGYIMLVKSFTDNLSWSVQRKLVNNYFKKPSSVQQLPSSFAEALRLAADLEEEKQKLVTKTLMLEQRIAENEPKITYYDTILSSKDVLNPEQIAKDYGLSAIALNKLLHEENVQYKRGGQWLLYQEYQDKGYTKSHTIQKRN